MLATKYKIMWLRSRIRVLLGWIFISSKPLDFLPSPFMVLQGKITSWKIIQLTEHWVPKIDSVWHRIKSICSKRWGTSKSKHSKVMFSCTDHYYSRENREFNGSRSKCQGCVFSLLKCVRLKKRSAGFTCQRKCRKKIMETQLRWAERLRESAEW